MNLTQLFTQISHQMNAELEAARAAHARWYTRPPASPQRRAAHRRTRRNPSPATMRHIRESAATHKKALA
jgi:hypothetical protein